MADQQLMLSFCTTRTDELAAVWRKGDKERAAAIAKDITNMLKDTMTIPHIYYRLFRFNLSFFLPPGRHIVIVDNSDIELSPAIIRSAATTAGSEEALLRMSQELVKLGYRVTIVCNTQALAGYTLPTANPCFYPISHLRGIEDKIDCVIAWRRVDFFRLKYYLNAPIIYAPHDWYTGWFETKDVTATAFLTAKQQHVYLEHIPALGDITNAITGNGVDMGDFVANNLEQRDQALCVYCSSYNRGLKGLLECWLDIRAAHPDARLHVYYGRSTFIDWPKEEFEKVVTMMEALAEHGVTEMGRVSHDVLAQRLMLASIMCAQSDFHETYGISYAKAMAAGVIPVVPDVIDPCIFPPDITMLDSKSPTLRRDFTQLIIQRLHQGKAGELEELRQKCRQHACNNLSWEGSARRLSNLIDLIL